MIPELGTFALVLALLLALAQAFFGIAGPALGKERWSAVARPAALGQTALSLLALLALADAFVQHPWRDARTSSSPCRACAG